MAGTPIRRAVTYARYSTDKQDPTSIEAQRASCHRYCEQQGLMVVGDYADEAISGSTLQRPGLQRLLADARARAFEVVVVDTLDRLSRDHVDLPVLFRELSTFRIEVHAPGRGKLDTISLQAQSISNAVHSDSVRRQTHRSMSKAVEEGKSAGGRCYGYRKVLGFDDRGRPLTGLQEIDETQARVVIWIFEKYAEGWTPARIAADLNLRKVTPPRGSIWRQSTINGNRKRGTGILNNELYRGWRVWNRQEFVTKPSSLGAASGAPSARLGRGKANRQRMALPRDLSEVVRAHVPGLEIVPAPLWERVKARQAVLDAKLERQRAANTGGTRRTGIGAARSNLSILAGVLFCGCCGGTMTASGGHYIQCSTAKETGGSRCANKQNYRREAIESDLLTKLRTELMRPKAIAGFVTVYNRMVAGQSAERASSREALARDLATIEGEIRNIVDAIARGLFHASLKDKLDALEARKAGIAAELAAPGPAPISLHPGAAAAYREAVIELEKGLADPEDGPRAREGVRALIDRLVLHPRPDLGKSAFDLDVEGVLGQMLQLTGIKQRDAEVVASTSRCSGQLVAGAGFEPATFRL